MRHISLLVLTLLFATTARAVECGSGLTQVSDAPSYAQLLRSEPLAEFRKLETLGDAPVSPGVAPIVGRIRHDLDGRLAAGSVLELPQFVEARRRLELLRAEFISLSKLEYPYDATNAAVFRYVEILSRLFRGADPGIDGDYHQKFALGVQDEVLSRGDGTHVFFANESVGDLYFWDIRAAATYLLWVMEFPPFAFTAADYRGGPLAPRETLMAYIDGLDLDGEEILKHDVGHSYLMKRQDRWLFATLDEPRERLVARWIETKNEIRERYRALRTEDRELATAAKFLISELIHERGYQFFLPILYQQIRSDKWEHIIAFKKSKNYWAKQGLSDAEFARIGEARRWLENVIREMTIRANESRIAELSAESNAVLMKRWHKIATYTGVPVKIEIRSPRDVRVTLDVPGLGWKTASLYEIALVLGEPSDLNTADEISNYDRYREALSPIETYKLSRALTLLRQKKSAQFTHTLPPDEMIGRISARDRTRLTFTEPSGRVSDFDLAEVSFQREPAVPKNPPSKYINLDPGARFIETSALREAYELYDRSLNPTAPPFVTLETAAGKFELAMVNMHDMRVATAVSSLLTRSLEDGKYTKGGYLPPPIVERVQKEIISPFGVSQLWGRMGRRFVLSRDVGGGLREVVASALVAESRDNIFFFTSRFNNLKQSRLAETIDLGDRWLEKFDFPDVHRYKPDGYHHFANFVVERDGMRGLGLASLMIEEIVKKFSRDFLMATGGRIEHSQRLLCGKGFWQIGDPPWLARMSKLGFTRRLGAESFHIDQPWDPLIPTYDGEGKVIDHITYNESFGMPQLYENARGDEDTSGDPFPERVAHVIELARGGRAKLQYFQLLFPFSRVVDRARKQGER